MAVALLFFLAVLEVTSPMSPVHTTSGRHFVFAIPFVNADGRNMKGRTADLRFTTEEEKFTVVVSFPNLPRRRLNPTYYDHTCTVRRAEMCTFDLLFKIMFPSKTGITLPAKVESDVPVCGVIVVSSGSWRAATMFLLLPHHAWSKAYYVTTSNVGYPFIMLFTYKTKIRARLKFPKFKKTFNVPCGGNRNCASNSIVTLNLKPLRVWKLYIKRKGVSFHNTLIEANHPIYVVAGNTALKYNIGGSDTCAFSLRPNDKWGKEYIIPKFSNYFGTKSRTFYRITTKRIPFEYDLFQNGKKNTKRLTNYEEVGRITHFGDPVVFRANIPFGLYQMITDRGLEPGCLSIVPTEHWINGYIYYRADELFDSKAFIKKRIVITTAKRSGINRRGSSNFHWLSYPMVSPSRTYNYGMFTVLSYPSSIYTTQPNARMVIYKMLSAPGDKPSNAYFSSPSYLSKIYDAGCERTDPLFNDGVDNDCDGFVDEEWKNGKDDDNDGVIDEDNIETPMEPEWMPWTATCRMDCKGKYHTKRIRDCRRSRYAYIMTRTCKGKDEVCGSAGKTCPTFCKKVQLAKCNRQPGCKSYVSPESHRCSECKPGYLGHHCLSPCPDGWKGKDCLTAPSKEDLRPFGKKAKMEKKKKEKEKKEKEEKERKDKERKEREMTQKEKRKRKKREWNEEGEDVLQTGEEQWEQRERARKEKAMKEKKEKARKERERKEKERKEREEKEMTKKALKKRREKERKKRERKEKIKKVKVERERKEKERKEKKEKKRKERERKEQEKREKEERERRTKEEKERKERERKEREELGIKRKEWERKERERIETEKKDRGSKNGNENEENENNESEGGLENEEEEGNKKGKKEGNKKKESERNEKEKKDKENGSKDWLLIMAIVVLVCIVDAALIGLIIWAVRKRRNQNVEDKKRKGEEEQEEGEKKEGTGVETEEGTDVDGVESNLGTSTDWEEGSNI